MEYKGYYDLNGSYKLSEELILRLVSNGLTFRSNSGCISNYELLAILHFSHICDLEGKIEDFKTLELCEITGCSRRAAYHILENLIDKGFITASSSDWYGRRNLKLLGNDFHNYETEKKRYLNTNYTFFNYRHCDYKAFKALSLNAKKLLVYLLFQYNPKYGYRASLDTLVSVLGVQKKRLVLSYIKELSEMFDKSFFLIRGSKELRLKYSTVQLPSKNPFFTPREGIKSDQDTHFHFKMRNFLLRNNIIPKSLIHPDRTSRETIHSLYSLTIRFLKEKLPYTEIERSIFHLLLLNGSLDEITILHLNQYLSEKYLLKCG
ncbi:MAG: hypothetical protein IJT16_03970 [Lachnospiraceae bacterium]|nr:hypothetical protein [Lachnospiraceae bacterium]